METPKKPRKNARRSKGICCEDGCEKETRGGYLLHCNTHYMRRKKEGLAALKAPGKPEFNGRWISDANGYVIVKATGHPLAYKHGSVYEHRKVAYDEHGPGPHSCNWCDIQLEWKDIHVDHLDWDRQNNAPENLKISCAPCNVNRIEKKSTPKPEPQPDIAAIQKSMNLRSLVRRLDD